MLTSEAKWRVGHDGTDRAGSETAFRNAYPPAQRGTTAGRKSRTLRASLQEQRTAQAAGGDEAVSPEPGDVCADAVVAGSVAPAAGATAVATATFPVKPQPDPVGPQPDPRRVWVGFDLGGTKMLAKLYTDDFEELAKKRKKTRAQDGVQAGLKRMIKATEKCLDKAGVSRDALAGIGVGCPGPLDLKKGVVREAPNLGWYDVPLKKELQDAFGCPVVICNDVDAGVYGEYRFGAGRGGRCVLGLFPGTGIGGGCVYRGEIVQGERLSCMEVGHIIVQPEGPRCGCGQRGCLEAIASRLAIAAAAAQAVHRGQAPALKKLAGADLERIRSGVLAEAIRQGDGVIEEIVVQAAEAIGIALAGIVHLLAPDVIVLGGGLVEAMPKLLRRTVQQTIDRHILQTFRDTFRVVCAELGDDASVRGAAAWARERILREAGG